MALHYTKPFLDKLEGLFAEAGFQIRYERGNFRSGFCLLEAKKIVVINKFASTENKINILAELAGNIASFEDMLSDSTREFFQQLKQTAIKF